MSDALPTSAATPPIPKEPVSPPAEPSPGPAGIRTVVAKGERVPWPRRVIAMGVLFALLALLLHALPRPYQPLATRAVQGLGATYGHTHDAYRGEVSALEPYSGEATEAEREAYARELWRYRWLGVYREVLLRILEWAAATCVFVALGLVFVERRRARRALEQTGARLEPAVLHRETLAGTPLDSTTASATSPTPATPVTPPSASGSTPAFSRGEPPEEVTPPAPTPVPAAPRAAIVPGMLDVRPIEDDDDFDHDDETSAPNLAKRALKADARSAPARPPEPLPLPQFFLQRRRDPSHPVVHPGEATPLPAADETLAGPPPVESKPVGNDASKDPPKSE